MKWTMKFSVHQNNFVRLVCLTLIGLLIVGVSVNLTLTEASVNNSRPDNTTNSYIGISSGLYCVQDSCFSTLSTTISDAGGLLLGTGTKGDPYIIENLNISASSGILLSQITKYVTIRNNIITATAFNAIELFNVTGEIIIENNNITTGTPISGGGFYGIKGGLVNSSMIVRNNYFNNNTDWAVYIGHPSNSSYIYNNTLVNTRKGIFSRYSNSTIIYNNTISNNTLDLITVQFNNETKIYDNRIYNSGNGLNIIFNNYTLIENNTINNITGSNQYAISLTKSSLTDHIGIIRNNSISNIDGVGIESNGFSLIEKNHISNTGLGGIQSLFNSTVQYNWVENFNLNNDSAGKDGGISGYDDLIAIGNTIINGNSDGIHTSANAIVMNNLIKNVGGNGITTDGASSQITGNTVINTTYNGIVCAGDGVNTDINQNNIQDAKQDGLHIVFAPGVSVDSNVIINSGGSGIYLESSSDSLVTNNTVTNSSLFGFHLVNSPSTFSNNVLTEEIFIDTGFATPFLSAYADFSFTGDTVKGLPFAYIVNGNANITSQKGQIYIVYSTGITVTNNDFSNTKIPITIAFSSGITLDGLTITDSYLYAVKIVGTNPNVGQNSEVTITGSTISKTNGTGILSDVTVNVHNSYIVDNYGDGLYVSGQSLIYENEISRNSKIGVRINSGSNGVEIRDNLFDSNVGYAVAVESSYYSSTTQNALIHHNNFVNNNAGGSSQALDNGSSNQWYDFAISEGNYWDDWSGTGAYSIDGTANSEDLYPLGTKIIFPRIIKDPTTTTTSTNPDTSTTNSNSGQNSNPVENNDGFLPAPPLSVLAFFMLFLIVNIYRRKKK